jgi:hypothetical protein
MVGSRFQLPWMEKLNDEPKLCHQGDIDKLCQTKCRSDIELLIKSWGNLPGEIERQ